MPNNDNVTSAGTSLTIPALHVSKFNMPSVNRCKPLAIPTANLSSPIRLPTLISSLSAYENTLKIPDEFLTLDHFPKLCKLKKEFNQASVRMTLSEINLSLQKPIIAAPNPLLLDQQQPTCNVTIKLEAPTLPCTQRQPQAAPLQEIKQATSSIDYFSKDSLAIATLVPVTTAVFTVFSAVPKALRTQAQVDATTGIGFSKLLPVLATQGRANLIRAGATTGIKQVTDGNNKSNTTRAISRIFGFSAAEMAVLGPSRTSALRANIGSTPISFKMVSGLARADLVRLALGVRTTNATLSASACFLFNPVLTRIIQSNSSLDQRNSSRAAAAVTGLFTGTVLNPLSVLEAKEAQSAKYNPETMRVVYKNAFTLTKEMLLMPHTTKQFFKGAAWNIPITALCFVLWQVSIELNEKLWESASESNTKIPAASY